MKTSLFSLALVLFTVSQAHARARVEHQYDCENNDAGGSTLVVNVGDNDETMTFDGTKATFDPSYTSRSGDGMQRYIPESSLDGEDATEILIQPKLLDAASSGRLVIYYRGEGFGSVVYACTLSR